MILYILFYYIIYIHIYLYILETFIYNFILLTHMKRKIIKLGTATLVVSLPSKWTKKFNLKSGNDLELEEANSNLIIEVLKKSL